MTTFIDINAIRRGKRGTTPTASLPRRAFYTWCDDLYYHASTGEWARAIEDEDAEEPTIAGFLLCLPPSPAVSPVVRYDFAIALQVTAASDEDSGDVQAEEEHQRQLADAADLFERAPSGHFACVLGTSSWGVVLAVGSTPDEASDNAIVAEREQDPDLDVVGLHATMLARGSLCVRPITRAALSAFREDGQDCRFRISDEGRVDVATTGDDWSAEVN